LSSVLIEFMLTCVSDSFRSGGAMGPSDAEVSSSDAPTFVGLVRPPFHNDPGVLEHPYELAVSDEQ
jgi:hypothetical protein